MLESHARVRAALFDLVRDAWSRFFEIFSSVCNKEKHS